MKSGPPNWVGDIARLNNDVWVCKTEEDLHVLSAALIDGDKVALAKMEQTVCPKQPKGTEFFMDSVEFSARGYAVCIRPGGETACQWTEWGWLDRPVPRPSFSPRR
jgi:hypothetical protein